MQDLEIERFRRVRQRENAHIVMPRCLANKRKRITEREREIGVYSGGSCRPSKDCRKYAWVYIQIKVIPKAPVYL